MRFRDHYDWIVLGNHPGALLSASLVSAMGLSVLVLPFTPALKPFTSDRGLVFDPEPNSLLGLGNSEENSGLLLQCLKRMGVGAQELEKFDRSEVFPQVLTPNCRMVFSRNEGLNFELTRELGVDSAAALGLLEVLASLESDYLQSWRNLPKRLSSNPWACSRFLKSQQIHELKKQLKTKHQAALLDSAGQTEGIASLQKRFAQVTQWLDPSRCASDWASAIGRFDLPELCSGLWYGITQTQEPNPLMRDLLLRLMLSRTAGSFLGGLTAYRQFLLNAAKRAGAHIAENEQCKHIFIDRGRFAGVQISARGSIISTQGGVVGSSLKNVFDRTTLTGNNWFYLKKSASTPVGWHFTLSFLVRTEALNSKLGSRAVWQEKDAPPLEIEVLKPRSNSPSAAHWSVVLLRTLMPFSEESLTPEFQRGMARRMFRQVCEILPYFESHILQVYPRFSTPTGRSVFGNEELQDAQPSALVDFQQIYGFSSLSQIPDPLLVFQKSARGAQSGIEGLFVASQESYPSLGSLGPTVACLQSVAWLSDRLGLKGPFS
ncbi:MAG: hypothetical protein ACO3A2_10685 [Bdellovibrionia bacterium]